MKIDMNLRIAFILWGVLLGPFVLLATNVLLHGLFFRTVLGDVREVYVFFLTAPLGVILGAVFGALSGGAVSLLSQGDSVSAGRFSVKAGGILFGILFCLGLFLVRGGGSHSLLYSLYCTLFWFGSSLFWSGALALYGILLLKR